ncbi:MAG TPA: hypothetical protein VJY62_02455 [Bacteroidia bacterium]|nr:hypothetical protein [Bacteroidia bacterium]
MAEREESILLKVKIDVDELKQKLVESKTEIAKLKQENKDFATEAAAALKSGAIATYQELTEKIVNNELRVKELNTETKNLTNVITLQTQANKAADGSYEQLLRNFQLASIELKNQKELLEQDAQGNYILTEAYKKSSDQVAKAKDAIIAFDQGIRDGRTNVGNYEVSFRKAFDQLPAVTLQLKSIQQNIAELNSKFQEGGVTQKEFEQQNIQLTEQLTLTTEQLNKIHNEMSNVSQNTEVVANAFKSLKQQLLEAKEEATKIAQEFGFDSEQALEAQKKVAGLTDQLGDFNKRVEALNPDAKFKAFTQAAGALAGGISALQGGMALFGNTSEATQEALLKVQAAMAFASGLNQLAELGDAFKNIKAILGLTTVAQQAQNVAQAEGTVATVAGTAATTGFAAAEGTAAVGATTLGTAIKAMLGPLGLVLIAAGALVAIFASDAFGAAEQSVESLTKSFESNNQVHKDMLSLIKERNEAEVTSLENAVSLAQERKESEESIFELQKSLVNARKDGNRQELVENKQHLEDLFQQQQQIRHKMIGDLEEEERKKAEESLKSITEEVSSIKEANSRIVNENKKLNTDLELLDESHVENKRKALQEETTLRLSLIKDQHTKEIEEERNALTDQLEAIKGTASDTQSFRTLLAQQTNEKIAEINRKFSKQDIEERNQLEINSTLEGTQKRIDAEIKAEESIRDFKLTDERLTENQRQLIIQESQQKISGLEEKRIEVINKVHQEEIDLEKRKQDALLEIRKSVTSDDLEEQFKLRLSEITNNLQQESQVRETARENDLSVNELFLNRELQAIENSDDFKLKSLEDQEKERNEIIEESRKKELAINAAYDAENLAAFYKASKAIQEATRAANDQRIKDLLDLKQLELQASGDPLEALNKKLQILDLEEEAEIASENEKIQNEEIFRQQRVEQSNKEVEDERERIINSTEFALLNAEERATTLISLDRQRVDDEQAINEKSEQLKETSEKTKTLIVTKYNKARTLVVEEQERAQLEITTNTLGDAAALFKKHTGAYKVLASAQALINTYLSATQAYLDGLEAGGPYGIVLGAIAAAAAIAAGLANVAKINETPVAEKGGFIAQGPSHAEGGIDVVDKKGKPIVNIEGGEAAVFVDEVTTGIVSKTTTSKKLDIINDLIHNEGKNVVLANTIDQQPTPLSAKRETTTHPQKTVVAKFENGGFINDDSLIQYRVKRALNVTKFNLETENLDRNSSEFTKKQQDLTTILNTLTKDYFEQAVKTTFLNQDQKTELLNQVTKVTNSSDGSSRQKSLQELKSFSEEVLRINQDTSLKMLEEKRQAFSEEIKISTERFGKQAVNAPVESERFGKAAVNKTEEESLLRTNDLTESINEKRMALLKEESKSINEILTSTKTVNEVLSNLTGQQTSVTGSITDTSNLQRSITQTSNNFSSANFSSFSGLQNSLSQVKTSPFVSGDFFSFAPPVFPGAGDTGEVATQSLLSDLISAFRNMPAPIVTVEDINAGLESKVLVEGDANL